jgi:hypothetical protein
MHAVKRVEPAAIAAVTSISNAANTDAARKREKDSFGCIDTRYI